LTGSVMWRSTQGQLHCLGGGFGVGAGSSSVPQLCAQQGQLDVALQHFAAAVTLVWSANGQSQVAAQHQPCGNARGRLQTKASNRAATVPIKLIISLPR